MGELYVATPGNIRFREVADDRCSLCINGQVIFSDTSPVTNATGMVTLSAGWHPIEVDYTEQTGPANCNIQWDPTGGTAFVSIPVGNLRAEVVSEEWSDELAESGAFDYYADKELYDLDASDANIELVDDVYVPKAGLSNHPVVEVTWYGAKAYCRWLSACSGRPVVLPPEWVWEFAASGGDSDVDAYYYPWGPKFLGATHDNANYAGTGRIDIYGQSSPVGMFPAYHSLRDMAGNVWEWTDSEKDGSPEFSVIRGGSWNQAADPFISTAYRAAYKSRAYGDETLGFRPAIIYRASSFTQPGFVNIGTNLPFSSRNDTFGGFELPLAPYQVACTETRIENFVEFLNTGQGMGWCSRIGQRVVGAGVEWFMGETWCVIGDSDGIIYTNNAYSIDIKHANMPVTDVTWFGASAYAQFLAHEAAGGCTYDLPSEWQWEKAMTSGSRLTPLRETVVTDVGASGLEVQHDYTFWPGFYDGLRNVQEWTASKPDEALDSCAVIRGNANAYSRHYDGYSLRSGYCEKTERYPSLGFRTAVNHYAPRFNEQVPAQLLSSGGAVVTQFVSATVYGDLPVDWHLLNAPIWIGVTNLEQRRAAIWFDPPGSETASVVTVSLSDGVMTSYQQVAVAVVTNGIRLVDVPEAVVLFANGIQEHMFVRAELVGISGAVSWSVSGAPDWAALSPIGGNTAKISLFPTNITSASMWVMAQLGQFVTSNRIDVVITNHAPRIIIGPSSVDLSAATPHMDVMFVAQDDDVGQRLLWSVVGDPAWAQIQWVHDVQALVRLSRPSVYFQTNLTIAVSDGYSTAYRSVTVHDGNQRPRIVSAPTAIVRSLGAPVETHSLVGYDPDIEDRVNWSLTGGDGLVTVTHTGDSGVALMNITDSSTSTGLSVTVQLADGQLTTSVVCSIVFTNSAPLITGDTNAHYLPVGQGALFLFGVTDVDGEQPLSIDVESVTAGLEWRLLSETNMVVDVGGATSASGGVRIVISDSYVSKTVDVVFVVMSSTPNHAPVLQGLPSNINVKQYDEPLVYLLDMLDDDSDDWLSLVLAGGAPNVELRLTGARTAELQIVPGLQHTATNIILVLSDGTTNVLGSFSLAVGAPVIDSHAIVAAEYFIDEEPSPGAGTLLLAQHDEVYGDTLSYVRALGVTENLTNGAHRIGVRLQRQDGQWGVSQWMHFVVYGDTSVSRPSIEPSFTDFSASLNSGGVSYWKVMRSVTGEQAQVFETDRMVTDSAAYTSGVHKVGVSFQDSLARTSVTGGASVVVYDDANVEVAGRTEIVGAEYFWDSTPSDGFGFPLPLSGRYAGNSAGIVDVDDIGTGHVVPGWHLLGLRLESNDGGWGSPFYLSVDVVTENQALTLVNLHVESNIGDPDLEYDSLHPTGTVMRLGVPETHSHAGADYVLDGWIGTGDVPGSGLSNEVSFILTQASDLTWLWVADADVTAHSDYGEVYGTGGWTWYPSFDLGYAAYPAQTSATLWVDSHVVLSADERLACTGFTGSGSIPAQGDEDRVTFTVKTSDSEVWWAWRREFRLDSAVVGGGEIWGNRGWYPTGTVVMLEAVADPGSHLLRWEGGFSGTSTTATVEMLAPRSVVAVFTSNTGVLRFDVVDPLTLETNLVGHYLPGTVVTADYPVMTDLGTGSRLVVTGWVASGSAPGSGSGHETTFTIDTDTIVAWQGVRQHFVTVEAIPSSLGELFVEGKQSGLYSNWYDEGVVTISNRPSAGARFAGYARDLAGAASPVSMYLSNPLNIAGLFRNLAQPSDYVAVNGGALVSSNVNVFSFEPIIEDFAVKKTEVTVSEYCQYLSDALVCGTVSMESTNSVRGRNPARDYVQGLAIAVSTTADRQVLSRSRWLRTKINGAVVVDAGYFSPLLSVAGANGYYGAAYGQIYVPQQSNVLLRVSCSGTTSIHIARNAVFDAVSGTSVITGSFDYGWCNFSLVFCLPGPSPSLNLEWDLTATGDHFSTVPSVRMRHVSERAISQVEFAELHVGGERSGHAIITADYVTVRPVTGGNFVAGVVQDDFVIEATVSRPTAGYAGVMVRLDDLADAPYVLVRVESSGALVTSYRAEKSSGVTTSSWRPPVPAQCPVRVVRVGNRYQTMVEVEGNWYDAFSGTTEERWATVGIEGVSPVLAGFYSSAADATFSGYRFNLPNDGNYFDEMELVDLGAEHCAVSYDLSTFTALVAALNRPVTEVSWYGAQGYVLWLRECTGNAGYDLPSEWQFEYLASGGDSIADTGMYPWPVGGKSTDYANLSGSHGNDVYMSVADVASFDLCRGVNDLAGNVWEWTRSLHWQNGVWRSIRGASWNHDVEVAASAYRDYYGLPYYSNAEIGFRPVRTVSPALHGYVLVPEGTWTSPNAHVASFPDEGLGNFYIKSTEVTVDEYVDFINALLIANAVTITNGIVEGISTDWHAGHQLLVVSNHPYLATNGTSVLEAVAGCARKPISHVSWYGADAYTKWLSLNDLNYAYRLPSEWEWEKAAFYGVSWDESWSSPLTFPENMPTEGLLLDVGTRTPGSPYQGSAELGLFDLLGNVSEWTASCPPHLSSIRYVRGGGLNQDPGMRNAGYRERYESKDFTDIAIGFRPIAIAIGSSISMLTTNMSFLADAGVFRVPVYATNPRRVTRLSWRVESNPVGVSLVADGSEVSWLEVDTHMPFGGTNIALIIDDGYERATAYVDISEFSYGGILRAFIDPSAISDNAGWRIVSVGASNWLVSGSVQMNLTTGQLVTVEFKPLVYWETPSPVTVWIQSSGESLCTGEYVPIMTTRGTPLHWLATHSLSTNEAGEDSDADSDGMPAWAEYVADTHPSDSNSVLGITTIRRESNAVRIEWQGGHQAAQYLEACSDLSGCATSWIPIFTNASPTTVTNYVHDLGTPSKVLFYRIRADRD